MSGGARDSQPTFYEVALLLIDRTHRAWMAATLVLLVLSTGAYLVYARQAPDGPRGGSVPGLLFGIAGSLLMLFAGLLSLRKRFPAWRLGRAQTWLRGHIWLGLLSGPLILFHSGFRWGGLLEQIVLLLALAIIVSGVIGLALQQVIPRMMHEAVPAEAMYDQLPYVCQSLRASADEAIAQACGAELALAPVAESGDPRGVLAGFYRETVRPFLATAAPLDTPLAHGTSATATFAQLKQRMPQELHGCLDRLARLCDERRHLLTQARLHAWMHGWLMVHVPLSAALLVLGLAHAVLALYY